VKVTGKLAISRSGHDSGKLYVVIKEEERGVWLANGVIRPVERPKRKNKKHIQVIKKLPEEVEALLNGDFRNEDIKRAIKIYNSGGRR
jgi:ribosomal protein L14E/L6E/L27E